jgi:hypothetical protein
MIMPWAKRALLVPLILMLTGCLWGPGKFQSTLTLLRNGNFTLDYRGEIVLQLPPEQKAKIAPWNDIMAHCTKDGTVEVVESGINPDDPDRRQCTAEEIAQLKTEHAAAVAQRTSPKDEESQEVAKMFGLSGIDDVSARDFAERLRKYAGWRSVTYKGGGAFDVDFHLEGRATQDFIFPLLPDNDLIVPFIAIRRRADGSVFVTAPAFVGGGGPIASRLGGDSAGKMMRDGPVSYAEGRFTILTDGEILTNNSEDGPKAAAPGKMLVWDVRSSSTKIPEALVRL